MTECILDQPISSAWPVASDWLECMLGVPTAADVRATTSLSAGLCPPVHREERWPSSHSGCVQFGSPTVADARPGPF
jgi:hypothetical protein